MAKSRMTHYYDENDHPRLLPSYCIFADFLGFRQEIKDAVASDKEEEVFRHFMAKVEPIIREVTGSTLLESSERRMWDTKVFTDNVIFGYPLWSQDGESELAQPLLTLSVFQLSCAIEGYFVRGGWAVGKLFINENTVYGAALLDAYELENTKAVYPRIVLSDRFKELARSHMTHYAPDYSPPHCRYLIIDDCGALAVNYLIIVAEEEEVRWDLLDRHARCVSQKLGEHKNNQRVLEKFQWLAAYHNFICDQLTHEDGYSSGIRIAGEFKDFGVRCLTREDV